MTGGEPGWRRAGSRLAARRVSGLETRRRPAVLCKAAMRRLALALAVFAASLPAFALDDPGLMHFKPLGWAADGSAFAWTESTGDEGGAGPTWKLAHVVDARTGERATYLYEPTESADDAKDLQAVADLDDGAAKLPRRGAFDAWLKAHPLAPLAGGRAKGDAKAVAHLSAGSVKDDGDGFDFDVPKGKRATVTFAVERGGKATPSASCAVKPPVRELVGYAAPAWSPDERRVAWSCYRHAGEWDYDVVVGPASGPRVEMLADATISKATIAAVAAALEKAGFFPTHAGPAQKARAATVVYAAKGFEAAAKAAAAAVPGGATVDGLSWKADADLVVAVGAGAR